jgi:hypothetical protein
MTNPIAVSQRARECLATAYEQAGYRDEAAAFRAGDWTCHDHPALVAMVRFEAEIRADERERAAKVADAAAARIEPYIDGGGLVAVSERATLREVRTIAQSIRNQKDHDHD